MNQEPTPAGEPTPAEIAAAPPDVLTLMLFQGAVRFGRQVQSALAAGDAPAGAHLVARVRAIVEQLEASLNPEAGPISGHLAAIYAYLKRRLALAAADPSALEEVVGDLEELGRTWEAVVRSREASGMLAGAWPGQDPPPPADTHY